MCRYSRNEGSILHLLYQSVADPSCSPRAKFGVETNSAPPISSSPAPSIVLRIRSNFPHDCRSQKNQWSYHLPKREIQPGSRKKKNISVPAGVFSAGACIHGTTLEYGSMGKEIGRWIPIDWIWVIVAGCHPWVCVWRLSFSVGSAELGQAIYLGRMAPLSGLS